MPECGQCGKDNPEGTAFCGYCASPLTKPAGNPGGLKPVGMPSSAIRGGAPPPPPRPEIRTPTFSAPPPPPQRGKGGGFEWIPWSELSGAQRAGRLIAILVVGIVFIVLVRVVVSSLAGLRGGASPNANVAEGAGSPITEGDRKDGIESLCKVFQIYGLPANDHDASEAAKNAGELFKLAGNQSPERSAYILSTIVGEFRSGKLGKADCETAGAPLPANVDTLGGPSDSNQNTNQ